MLQVLTEYDDVIISSVASATRASVNLSYIQILMSNLSMSHASPCSRKPNCTEIQAAVQNLACIPDTEEKLFLQEVPVDCDFLQNLSTA